jgi:hypothetical protein
LRFSPFQQKGYIGLSGTFHQSVAINEEQIFQKRAHIQHVLLGWSSSNAFINLYISTYSLCMQIGGGDQGATIENTCSLKYPSGKPLPALQFSLLGSQFCLMIAERIPTPRSPYLMPSPTTLVRLHTIFLFYLFLLKFNASTF